MAVQLGTSSSDQEFLDLLEQARLGNREAIGRLIDRCRPYLLKIAHDEGDANLQSKQGDSDVVQDACKTAFEVFRKFQGATSKEMRAWLRSILVRRLNDLRDRYAAGKRRAGAEVSLQKLAETDSRYEHLAASISTPSEQAVRQEESAQVELALAQLPELDRRLIEMRQKAGWAFADIARELNLSENALHKRWARAIQILQEKMGRLDAPANG